MESSHITAWSRAAHFPLTRSFPTLTQNAEAVLQYHLIPLNSSSTPTPTRNKQMNLTDCMYAETLHAYLFGLVRVLRGIPTTAALTIRLHIYTKVALGTAASPAVFAVHTCTNERDTSCCAAIAEGSPSVAHFSAGDGGLSRSSTASEERDASFPSVRVGGVRDGVLCPVGGTPIPPRAASARCRETPDRGRDRRGDQAPPTAPQRDESPATVPEVLAGPPQRVRRAVSRPTATGAVSLDRPPSAASASPEPFQPEPLQERRPRRGLRPTAPASAHRRSDIATLPVPVDHRRPEGFLVSLLAPSGGAESTCSRVSAMTNLSHPREKASLRNSSFCSSNNSVSQIASMYQSSLRRPRIRAHAQRKKNLAAARAAAAATAPEGDHQPETHREAHEHTSPPVGSGSRRRRPNTPERMEMRSRRAEEPEPAAAASVAVANSTALSADTAEELPGDSVSAETYTTTRPSSRSGLSSRRSKHRTSPRRQHSKHRSSAERDRPMVVATMAHCGSIYEEVARQLVTKHQWSRLQIAPRTDNARLFCPEKGTYLTQMNVHLLLGEKLSTERVARDRREAVRLGAQPYHHTSPSRPHPGMFLGRRPLASRFGGLPGSGALSPPALPMGADGLPRVVNYVESMRSITLKCSMVRTLLKHHQKDWRTLGTYLPQTFFIASRGSGARSDERVPLLYMAQRAAEEEEATPLWILKSSAGCHGKNIKIFKGDAQGIQQLCDFVDNDRSTGKNASMWVAQRYIDRPLLFHRRKFDIRCLALLRCHDSSIFVHRELVMRLSSVEYSRDTALCESPKDVYAHITNHCIQAEAEEYAAFEEENELWREHLDGLVRFKGKKLLKQRRRLQRQQQSTPRWAGAEDPTMPSTAPHLESIQEPTLANTIIPQMYYIIKDTIAAGRSGIPPDTKPPSTYSFQLFGYDFIVDEDLHVWLLEINGSPGIASRLVRQVATDIIDLAISPHFPKRKKKTNASPQKSKRGSPGNTVPDPLHRNGFERIYPTELPSEEFVEEDEEDDGTDEEEEPATP
eukprot:gene2104-1282_t